VRPSIGVDNMVLPIASSTVMSPSGEDVSTVTVPCAIVGYTFHDSASCIGAMALVVSVFVVSPLQRGSGPK
jgi:hypothetical protein